jgi:TP901-1 family phage major tail protein
MAAQLGLQMLLKVDSDGAGTYQTIGGITADDLTINSESVDTTSQDDTSRWRQLLAGAGVKSLSFSGSGVFKADASMTTVNTYVRTDVIRNWKIVVPALGTFTMLVKIQSVKFNSSHNGAVQFSISCESGGDVAFA